MRTPRWPSTSRISPGSNSAPRTATIRWPRSVPSGSSPLRAWTPRRSSSAWMRAARSSARRSHAGRRSSATRASSTRLRPRWSRRSGRSSTATGASWSRSADDSAGAGAGAMNLKQSEDYLLSLELFGMRFGLDRMHKLMTVLGMPQRRFASIHVVGTNGKSSTTRMTAAILERHGVRTGIYTSPHLRSFPERIEVAGQPLSDNAFAEAVARAAHAAELVDRTLPEGDEVTQFEALTAAAFHALAAAGVEVAVIEAGLGGRYDATNVIPSQVQVLTSVGLDHTRWLGDTIADIAAEKLAVVRDHATLVVPPDLAPEARPVAEHVAKEKHAHIVRADRDVGVTLAARGSFQRHNFALAATTAEAFLERSLDQQVVADAAAAVMVPGRM